MKNILCPIEFDFAYDNGGSENGGTMDRYTIQLTWENGDSILIGSNAIASIWSTDDAYMVKEEIEQDKEDGNTNIGNEIDWEQLPDELKTIINNYIEEM